MTRSTTFPILLLAALLGLALPELHAYDGPGKELVVTLYRGQNEGINDSLEDPRLRKNFVKLFGYTQYERIGTDMVYPHSYSPVTAWPNKLFALSINAVQSGTNHYEFNLEQDGKSILKGNFIPKPGLPLIIKGPLYDNGILILVVKTSN